ncbi:unnamed protein product [Caenorhabditis sp. 36 PRJEB53466]|nr:unnamed protein product [Caenorhabditis sp. 36 PRJEB53466]
MRFWVLLQWLSFITVLVHGNKVIDNNLELVTRDLSILARTINGISIQAELVNANSSSKYLNVVSELIGAYSGSSLGKVDILKTRFLADSLAQFARSVANVQAVQVDVAAVTSVVEMFGSMSDKLEVISSVVSADPSEEFKNRINEVKIKTVNSFVDFFNVSTIETASGYLAQILDLRSTHFGDLTKVFNAIQAFKKDIGSLKSKLGQLSAYETELAALLKLSGCKDTLENVIKVSQFAQYYKANFTSFQTLKSILGGKLGSEVSRLSPIAKNHSTINELGAVLKNIEKTVGSTGKPRQTKEATAGLPNGIVDLEAMLADLNGTWLRDAIGDGNDIEPLRALLRPISDFIAEMKPLAVSWKNVNDPKTLALFPQLSQLLIDAANDGEVASSGDPSESIDLLVKCLVDFKTITVDANLFQEFETTRNSLFSIDEAVSELKNALAEMAGMDELKAGTNGSLAQVIAVIASDSVEIDNVDVTCSKIKNIENVRISSNNLQKIVKSLKLFPNVGRLIETSPNWDAIEKMRKSLDGTGLLDVLKCIGNETFKANSVNKMLSFRTKLQAIKRMSSEIGAIKQHTLKVEELKSRLISVANVVKSMRRGSRRKSAANGNVPTNLARPQLVAQDFGKGVEVLRKLESVRKTQVVVMKILKSGARVSSAIDQTNVTVWTEENKKGLEELVKKLSALNERAGRFRSKDLLTLGEVFDEAATIRGVPIDSRLLIDPISTALANSADQTVKSAADDFKTVGALQLDYSNLQVDLTSARSTLKPLRTFFDELFGIKRLTTATDDDKSSADSSSFDWLTAGMIVIPLCGVAGVASLGYVTYRVVEKKHPFFWKQLFLSQKKLQEAYILQSRYLAFQEKMLEVGNVKSLLEAVDRNDFESAAYFVNHGAWIDAPHKVSTCLHIAVENANPEMVELLIKNGANRGALNEDYKTPEQLVSNLIAQEQDSTKKEQLKQIKSLFKSLNGKKFKRKVPDLLPIEHFKIFIMEDARDSEFAQKFGNLITGDLSEATHVVVRTEDDGVYSPDGEQAINTIVVFGRAMLMKDTWLTACIKSKKAMRDDYKYRVKEVRYIDVVYATVLAWHQSWHMKEVNFLYGLHYAMKPTYVLNNQGASVPTSSPDGRHIDDFLAAHGAQCNALQHLKQSAAEFGRPHFHQNLTSHWIISDSIYSSLYGGRETNEIYVSEIFVFMMARKTSFGPEKKATKAASSSANSSNTK